MMGGKKISKILGLFLVVFLQILPVIASAGRFSQNTRFLQLETLHRPEALCEATISGLRDRVRESQFERIIALRFQEYPQIFVTLANTPSVLNLLYSRPSQFLGQARWLSDAQLLEAERSNDRLPSFSADALRKFHAERMGAVLTSPVHRSFTSARQRKILLESEFWRRWLIPTIFSSDKNFSVLPLVLEDSADISSVGQLLERSRP